MCKTGGAYHFAVWCIRWEQKRACGLRYLRGSRVKRRTDVARHHSWAVDLPSLVGDARAGAAAGGPAKGLFDGREPPRNPDADACSFACSRNMPAATFLLLWILNISLHTPSGDTSDSFALRFRCILKFGNGTKLLYLNLDRARCIMRASVHA